MEKANLLKVLCDDVNEQGWAGVLLIRRGGGEEFFYTDKSDELIGTELAPGELFFQVSKRIKAGESKPFKYESDHFEEEFSSCGDFIGFHSALTDFADNYRGYEDLYFGGNDSVFKRLRNLLFDLRVSPPIPNNGSSTIVYSSNLAALIAYEILHIFSRNKEFERCPYCQLWYVRQPKQNRERPHCYECTPSKDKQIWSMYIRTRRQFIAEAKMLKERGHSLSEIIDNLDVSSRKRGIDWTRSKDENAKIDQLRKWLNIQ